jgi:putative glutamine amidotransferase
MSRTTGVRFLPEAKVSYTDLYLSVYVHTTAKWEESQYAEWLVKAGCYKADSPELADLVIFTGGPDVDPQLYGEEPHESVQVSSDRDAYDLKMYARCMADGIPMLGVCRGAQFLAVMNGFKLYQDINLHHTSHDMYDCINKRIIKNVSSVHHQAVIYEPDKGMEILAHCANRATTRHCNPKDTVFGYQPDVEAFFIRETCCIGIQGHPEYRKHEEFSAWVCSVIEKYVNLNVDLDWRHSVRRMKPDIIAQRDSLFDSKKKAMN